MFPAFTGSLSAESSKTESSKRRRATTPVLEMEQQQLVLRPKKKPSMDAGGNTGGLRGTNLSHDRLEIPKTVQITPADRFRQFLMLAFSQTTYGKDLDELLSPEKGFYAISSADGDVTLNNYAETPREKPPYKGVCNDLSYSFGQLLKKFFKDSAEVRVGKGTVKDYFPNGTHYFLLVWPKDKHDEVMRDIEKQKLPESAMMVDPSFKKVLGGKHKERLSDYTLVNVRELENFHPSTINNTYKPTGIQIPIGFIRDLAPESVAEYGKEALLFLQFDPPMEPGGMAYIRPLIQRQPRKQEYDDASQWLDALPEENRFKRFYNKLISDVFVSHMAFAEQKQEQRQKEQPFQHDLDWLFDLPSLEHSLDEHAGTSLAASSSELPSPVYGSFSEAQPFLGQNQVHYLNPLSGDQGIDPKLLQLPPAAHRDQAVLIMPDELTPLPFNWLSDAPVTHEPLMTNEEVSRLSETERRRYFDHNPLAEAAYAFWNYDNHTHAK